MALTPIDDNTILTLTNADLQQSAYLGYRSAPVASAQGLSINFDFYSYGGTGADGISFILLDGSQSPIRAGGFGGSLGYAPSLIAPAPFESGIVGGYVGIGFDEYGFYSNAVEARNGGPGVRPDAIAVRGSAALNYPYLVGTNTLPISLDNAGTTATRANSRRNAQIDITPTGLLSVKVDLNADGDYADAGENAIDSFNLVAANGALPATFKFGFAASTGNSTNVHEIGNFKVTTASGSSIPGSFTTDLLLSGGTTADTLQGSSGKDQLIGGDGADVLTGNRGGDRFIFSGTTKAAALRTSTAKSLDRITDFNFSEGDRCQLDFDNNLATSERPRRFFNAGQKTGNVVQAAKAAYRDKSLLKGNQGMKANEAVFFRLGSKSYLSVNDDKAGFSAGKDLVVDVTGIKLKPGDLSKAALVVGNYFV